MNDFANDVAEKWGPAFTTMATGGDLTAWRKMFGKSVTFKIDKGGKVACLKIGDKGTEGVQMSFEAFQKKTVGDLAQVGYAKTTAKNLGTLGDDMLLQITRWNKEGKAYMTACGVLTFDKDKLIVGMAAFGDPQVDSTKAEAKTEEAKSS